MTHPAKFIISNEFSGVEGSEVKKLEAEIAELKDLVPVAEQRGYSAGMKEMDSLLANTMSRLTHSLIENLDTQRAAIEREAITLAVQIAKTLAGHLLDAEPSAAIAAMASQCLDSLRKCPHIVFHVHPDSVATVEQHLKKLTYERGIEGRLIVLGDPDKRPGDCKIEWADGGFERSQSEITAKIEDAITRFLDKRAGILTDDDAQKEPL